MPWCEVPVKEVGSDLYGESKVIIEGLIFKTYITSVGTKVITRGISLE